MNQEILETLLAYCENRQQQLFAKGAEILRQGEKKDQLFILSSGSVEVIRDGIQIAIVQDRGAVFGEISALLKTPHNATVKTFEDSYFYVISNAEKFIVENPPVALCIARILAQRLATVDAQFADLKKKLTIF